METELPRWRQAMCWFADRASEVWDFVDKRDIDKHAMAWLVASAGWDLTRWSMGFISQGLAQKMDMTSMAAGIAAVGVPYGIFAGAVVKWYFERQDK